jgi:hypothetical protein
MCDMVGSDKDLDRSRRPGAENWWWSSIGRVLSGRTIGGRVTPCATCTMHKEMRSTYFLVEPQNQGRRFFGLDLKSDRPGFVIWDSKSPRWFLVWASKSVAPVWWFDTHDGLKIIVAVSWFRPQNQTGFGLLVASQNQRREVGTGYASRSSSLLHLEASRARVAQSGLKTDGCAMIYGARDIIAEVALR